MTPPERLLWQALSGRKCGVKFRRLHPIGPFIADVYSHDAGLVIEVDGDIAHGSQDSRRYDMERDKWMESMGLKVLRYTARDIFQNLHGIIIDISKHCRESILPNDPGKQWLFARSVKTSDLAYGGIDQHPIRICRVILEKTDEEVFDIATKEPCAFLTNICALHVCQYTRCN